MWGSARGPKAQPTVCVCVCLGPGEGVFAEKRPFVLARSVCLCLLARECVCAARVCVCVCGVWGRPGKVAGLSLSDQVDRHSLIWAREL